MKEQRSGAGMRIVSYQTVTNTQRYQNRDVAPLTVTAAYGIKRIAF